MKKIKWVACDLDGTLLRYENQVHIIEKEAITAINELINHDIKFTIVTGRKYSDAIGIYRSYNLGDKCSYIIACNGAIIYDTKQAKIIKESFMDYNRLKLVMQIANALYAKKYAFIIGMYRLDNSIVFNKEAKNHQYLVNNFITYEGDFSNRDYSFCEDITTEKDLLKAIFFFDNDAMNSVSDLESLRQQIIRDYHIKETEFVVTAPISVELNPQNTSKGEALKTLSKIMNISLNQTLSIGDAGNDISMFEVTKYSVTLNSSEPNVREKATHVLDTQASIVVADAINLLVLNDD